jgi:ADP-ribosylation factor-binding protein GGA
MDLLGGAIPAPSSTLAQSSASVGNDDDDEWTFASSVPDTSKEITVTNSSINVLFNVSRESDTALLIKSRVSNNTPVPITALTLQVAASKVSDHLSMK